MGFSGKCICALCINTLFKHFIINVIFIIIFFLLSFFQFIVYFLSDIQPAGNLNLLLAAAVAGVHTDDDDDGSSSDDKGDQECLTLDKAMELWMKYKTQQNGKITHF